MNNKKFESETDQKKGLLMKSLLKKFKHDVNVEK